MAAVFKVMFDFGGTDGTPGTEQNVDALGKQIYMECTTGPDTQVDNVKFYTDGGGYGTGITTKVGTETPVKNSGANTGYEVATGTPGDTGDEMVAGHGDA
jgi:hypothetical protein